VIAYLVNPIQSKRRDLLEGSGDGGECSGLNASTEHDLDEAFASLVKLGAAGLAVMGESFFDSQSERIVALSARYSVAAIYTFREYVMAGGLMSYGSSLTDSYRQAGIYAGRVLKGEKPADLPVFVMPWLCGDIVGAFWS
jgi:putative ABC transport system substrate-binding protein